jgi:hypothetical protein
MAVATSIPTATSIDRIAAIHLADSDGAASGLSLLQCLLLVPVADRLVSDDDERGRGGDEKQRAAHARTQAHRDHRA